MKRRVGATIAGLVVTASAAGFLLLAAQDAAHSAIDEELRTQLTEIGVTEDHIGRLNEDMVHEIEEILESEADPDDVVDSILALIEGQDGEEAQVQN
ncbi:hypothetical protein [Salinarimonas rosea]|uniref:hypothetical protein n=1 Tax=Salinarimonas rosea TaxID=552063 RepID=UPI00048B60AE|nr:hypothetical protein [Salinarimonas rosea]